jgi:hypothetical protein
MKNTLSFPLGIIATILGVAVFKHFNFETFTFQKPALDILYLAIFCVCMYLMFKKNGNKEDGVD